MFTDVSSRIAVNPPASYYGIAATDLDGDGLSEFVVAGFMTANRVLKWKDDRLLDVTPTALADPQQMTIGLAAGDLDGDGLEELYALNADTFAGPKTQSDRLYHRAAGGRWEDLFEHPENWPVRNLCSGRSVAVIDRRGTGRYGFLVANYGQRMRFYELGLDFTLNDLAPPLGFDSRLGGRGLWVGPILGERPDILAVNEHGPNLFYRNLGNGTFDELAEVLGLQDPGEHARGITALDANEDGRFDLVWANWEGPNRLMIRQPDGTFRDRATPAMAFPGQVRNVIAADFDNDGREELFFHSIGEPNRLFACSSPGEWRLVDAGPACEPHGTGTGAAVADVDGDGCLELLLAHGEAEAQPLSLFKVQPNGNHWLRVKPLTRFGAPARGATVRLTAGGRTQIRVIDGGSGYLCQMEPVAHFGLGAGNRVDSVRITWPDGTSASFSTMDANATYEIPFPQ
jgi:hypothetical protein